MSQAASKTSRRFRIALALTALLTTAGSAGAVPRLSPASPPIEVVDAWDRSHDVRAHLGMPIVLVYEDKDSSRMNQPFKNELARLLSSDERFRRGVAVFPVADVDGYDYWPARGFVKKAIREESLKQGTTIYCDWSGRVRTAVGLQKGTSNIVLFGKDGAVRFFHAGALSEGQRAQLLELLRSEVAP